MPQFDRSPLEYVTPDHLDRALQHLNAYFTSYTGRLFEELADTDRSHFTANDVVAVTSLSVSVPADAAHLILEDSGGAFAGLLSRLARFTITDPINEWNADLTALWNALQTLRGVGPVIASKLIATKLPGLIPIFDQHVADGLGYLGGGTYWRKWHAALASETAQRELENANLVRAQDPSGKPITGLRVLDVCIWMEQHGCDRGHEHPLRRGLATIHDVAGDRS